MSKTPRLPAPEICPVCGEEVPGNARACPECGADHNSGWREDAETRDALGESADDFDYDAFVEAEFGTGPKPRGIRLVWWITAIVVFAALAMMWLLVR